MFELDATVAYVGCDAGAVTGAANTGVVEAAGVINAGDVGATGADTEGLAFPCNRRRFGMVVPFMWIK